MWRECSASSPEILLRLLLRRDREVRCSVSNPLILLQRECETYVLGVQREYFRTSKLYRSKHSDYNLQKRSLTELHM